MNCILIFVIPTVGYCIEEDKYTVDFELKDLSGYLVKITVPFCLLFTKSTLIKRCKRGSLPTLS